MKRRYEAVDDVTITTDGATKRGTTYRIARSLPGGPATNVVEITDYDPDRRVTHESLSGPSRSDTALRSNRLSRAQKLVLDGRITDAGILGTAAPADHLATELFKCGMRKNLATFETTGGNPFLTPDPAAGLVSCSSFHQALWTAKRWPTTSPRLW